MKAKCRLIILTTVSVFTLFFILSPVNAAESKKVFKWKLEDQYGLASWNPQNLTIPLIKWIEKETHGRLQITRYEPGALASVANTFDALQKGVFQAAFMYPGFYSGVMPEADVDQGLPWGWITTKAQYISFFKFGMYDLMTKVYARHHLRYGVAFSLGCPYNVGTIKPATTLADLKGLKIRGVGSYANYLAAIGAAPVNIPYGEMYMALKMGTIDGYLASSSGLVSNKLGEVVKYYMLPTLNVVNCIWAYNLDAYNKLPDDIKHVLYLARYKAVELSELYSAIQQGTVRTAKKEYHVKFTTLSDKEQEKALAISMSIWNKISKKSPDCKKAVEIVKETDQFLGRMK